MKIKSKILILLFCFMLIPQFVRAAEDEDMSYLVNNGTFFVQNGWGAQPSWTDGDLKTSSKFWNLNYAVYRFDSPVNLGSISMLSDIPVFLRLSDKSGKELKVFKLLGDNKPVTVDVKGVSIITLNSEYGNAEISEISASAYIENVDKDKFVIANLAATYQLDKSLLLSWDAVVSPYFKQYEVYLDDNLFTTVTTHNFLFKDLVLGQSYKFEVRPVDTNNHRFTGATVVYQIPEPDTTPPVKPTGLVVTPSTYQAKLVWDKGIDDDIAGYEVYLGDTKLTGNLYNGLSYTIGNLTPETEYKAHIIAVDTSGNRSVSSDVVTFTTLPIKTAPSVAPSMSGSSGNGIGYLSWSSVKFADEYEVYEGESKIASTNFTHLSLKDLENGSTYSYQVVAVNEIGRSEPSNVVTITPNAKVANDITLSYGLIDITKSTSNWFGSIWHILAFVISIPLAFYIANRVKGVIIS